MGNRVKRVGRAASVLTKLAGLISASVLASGCSLIGFGRSGPDARAEMVPEIHEARADARPGCPAVDGAVVTAPAVTTAPALVTTDGGSAGPGEAELERRMDGNKRFVEGEAENLYSCPQRPSEVRIALPR